MSANARMWTDRVLRLVIAAILLQTLFFKFTGAPESKFIFETVGGEPLLRYGTGIAELIASVLLLFGPSIVAGALLALLLMLGAISGHLFTPLGIVVQGDGGLLFGMAVAVAFCAALLLCMRQAELVRLLGRRG